MPLPETYFHSGGGGFGGPIVKNRTFFWFSVEGYGSNTTRNGALRVADQRVRRRGDFSQTFDCAGQLQSIYDPTRTVETNEVGEYVFSAIPAGTYTVRASLTGFKTFQQTDLRVGTQQFLTLDVTLEMWHARGNDHRHRAVARWSRPRTPPPARSSTPRRWRRCRRRRGPRS